MLSLECGTMVEDLINSELARHIDWIHRIADKSGTVHQKLVGEISHKWLLVKTEGGANLLRDLVRNVRHSYTQVLADFRKFACVLQNHEIMLVYCVCQTKMKNAA